MESTSTQRADLLIIVPSLSGDQQEDEASAISPTSSPERQGSTEQSPTFISSPNKNVDSQHSCNINGKEKPRSPSRKSFSSSPMSIFNPRSYEEIYAEQAYLSLTLQAHAAQYCDLINKYSLTEAESFQGESRKCKRRARKQLGLLRSQLIHAAGQEQTIFARLGELFVEAKSRQTWNMAHNQRRQSLPTLRRHSHPQNNQEMRRRSMSRLNGASPAFIPQKDLFSHQEYDENATSTTDASDNEESKYAREDSETSLGELKMDAVLEHNDGQSKEKIPSLRRLSGDGYASILGRDRRLSLPAVLG